MADNCLLIDSISYSFIPILNVSNSKNKTHLVEQPQLPFITNCLRLDCDWNKISMEKRHLEILAQLESTIVFLSFFNLKKQTSGIFRQNLKCAASWSNLTDLAPPKTPKFVQFPSIFPRKKSKNVGTQCVVLWI